jgi:hypothetical protein
VAGDPALAAKLGSGARTAGRRIRHGVTIRAGERIYEGLASGLTAA